MNDLTSLKDFFLKQISYPPYGLYFSLQGLPKITHSAWGKGKTGQLTKKKETKTYKCDIKELERPHEGQYNF